MSVRYKFDGKCPDCGAALEETFEEKANNRWVRRTFWLDCPKCDYHAEGIEYKTGDQRKFIQRETVSDSSVSTTSELDKLHAVKDKSQLIGEFLDYMQSKSIRLCEWIPEADNDMGAFVPVSKSIEQILADYFDIDLNKVEAEKLKILENLRSGKHA